jgi:RNA polymerase sigma-70 factor (ECF subfamily)
MSTPIDPEVLLHEHAWLRRLARTLAADPASADDLVQDTWVAALERPPRASGADLRAWLAAVARNFARGGSRRGANAKARERAVARPETLPSVAESVERVAAQRELVDAVLALAPLERDLVVLRYFEDLPPRAIAARLGLSGATVRSRLSRALAELRGRLDRRFEGGRDAWAALLVPGGSESPTSSAPSLPFWLAALGTGAATLVVIVRTLAPSSGSEASAARSSSRRNPRPLRRASSRAPSKSRCRSRPPAINAWPLSARRLPLRPPPWPPR